MGMVDVVVHQSIALSDRPSRARFTAAPLQPPPHLQLASKARGSSGRPFTGRDLCLRPRPVLICAHRNPQILNQSYDASTRTFTVRHNWGTMALTHTLAAPVDHSGTLGSTMTLDLAISVTNTYNQTITRATVYPFSRGVSGEGKWELGGCTETPVPGCPGVKHGSSAATCHADWIKPQDGGSPMCRETDIGPGGVGSVPQVRPPTPDPLHSRLCWGVLDQALRCFLSE